MYSFKQFALAFNSWIFWLKILYYEITKRHWTGNFSKEYVDKWPKHLRWSVRRNGKVVAVNFWYIINDGLYEMREDHEW
jgi:hypothetical protein